MDVCTSAVICDERHDGVPRVLKKVGGLSYRLPPANLQRCHCDNTNSLVPQVAQESGSWLVNTASGTDSGLEGAAGVDPERAFRWQHRLLAHQPVALTKRESSAGGLSSAPDGSRSYQPKQAGKHVMQAHND